MYLSKKEKITKPYVVSVIMLLRLQQNEHDVLGWVQYVWSCITAFHACMISVMAAPWSQFHDLLMWKWISASCCIIGTFDFFYLFWCNLSASDKNTKHFFWSLTFSISFRSPAMCWCKISMYQVVPQEVVEAFLIACKSGDFDLANKEVNNVIAEGYPVSQMLSQVSWFYFYWCFFTIVSC